MKIRFVMHHVYGRGGGVLTVVRHLAADLAQRHDVELISAIRTYDEPTHAMPPGVKIRTVADLRPSAAPRNPVKRAVRRWATRRPSRLIPENEPFYDQCSLYTDFKMRRYLKSVRGGALIGMNPGINIGIARFGHPSVVLIGQEHRPFVVRTGDMRAAMKRYLPRLDVFMTLTDVDTKRFRQLLDGQVKVLTMPNATPEFTGTPSDHASKVVTAAGHLKRGKGFDRLIAAWELVHQSHPDWELRIFGSGEREGDLRNQITELGLDDTARLMGYSFNLREELAASSVFVLSSRVEGYGMVLVEAMSAGVPVVSFDCPAGPGSIITHDQDGVLVPNGDIPALAKAIIAMIELGDGRIVMGKAAMESASKRSQSEITARWEKLLRRQRRHKRGVQARSGKA